MLKSSEEDMRASPMAKGMEEVSTVEEKADENEERE